MPKNNRIVVLKDDTNNNAQRQTKMLEENWETTLQNNLNNNVGRQSSNNDGEKGARWNKKEKNKHEKITKKCKTKSFEQWQKQRVKTKGWFLKRISTVVFFGF